MGDPPPGGRWEVAVFASFLQLFICMYFVQVSPWFDVHGGTSILAANLLYEMMCVLPGVIYKDAPTSDFQFWGGDWLYGAIISIVTHEGVLRDNLEWFKLDCFDILLSNLGSKRELNCKRIFRVSVDFLININFNLSRGLTVTIKHFKGEIKFKFKK